MKNNLAKIDAGKRQIYITSAAGVLKNDLNAADVGYILNVSNLRIFSPQKIRTDFIRDFFDYNLLDINGKPIRPRIFSILRKAILAAMLIDKSEADILVVHCHAGVNRSALSICSYLIIFCDLNAADAIERVRCANMRYRNMPTLTNPHFILVLKHIEKLFPSGTVSR